LAIARSEEQAEALLAKARRLTPPQMLRLAGLWAGVSYGALDPHRQRRRNGARVALRYLGDEDDGRGVSARSAAAAAAIAEALAPESIQGSLSLRGPAADAAFAVADALDALANRRRLARVAFDELMRPWEELMKERSFEEETIA
jgi:hypothetical protein